MLSRRQLMRCSCSSGPPCGSTSGTAPWSWPRRVRHRSSRCRTLPGGVGYRGHPALRERDHGERRTDEDRRAPCQAVATFAGSESAQMMSSMTTREATCAETCAGGFCGVVGAAQTHYWPRLRSLQCKPAVPCARYGSTRGRWNRDVARRLMLAISADRDDETAGGLLVVGVAGLIGIRIAGRSLIGGSAQPRSRSCDHPMIRFCVSHAREEASSICSSNAAVLARGRRGATGW